MHIEVQVALNFVISYLYNKLPRRRVNLFGEEMEKALKLKFEGHWYPEKPFKGSAFRCLRVGTPIDPVIEQAARESGVEVADIREHLPDELSVWIDPGEVSYRIGEKGTVKVLYSEAENCGIEDSFGFSLGSIGITVGNGGVSCGDGNGEVGRPFNPEAQCFKPIEAVAASLAGLSLSPGAGNGNRNVAILPTSGISGNTNNVVNNNNNNSHNVISNNNNNGGNNGSPNGIGPNGSAYALDSGSPSPPGFKPPGAAATSPIHAFIPKPAAPVTFTTATFAQTKFGSTKLKSSGKRSHRLSPTEFSNYIKQRAAIQQQVHVVPPPHHHPPSQRPRSLSPKPNPTTPHLDPFLVMAAAAHAHAQSPPFGAYLTGDMGQSQFVGGNGNGNADNTKNFLDNMALNTLPYSAQYQHLLVAN